MRYVPAVERIVGEMHPHLTSTDIVPTEVLVKDIDLLEEKPTYYKAGFELSTLSESALSRLPNVTVETEVIDGEPAICRYLGRTLNELKMPSSHLYFLHIDRIVLRGTGGETSVSERTSKITYLTLCLSSITHYCRSGRTGVDGKFEMARGVQWAR